MNSGIDLRLERARAEYMQASERAESARRSLAEAMARVLEEDRTRLRRVLLVEDDPELRAALLELLAVEGFDAVLASSGEEALPLLRAKSFGTILVDIGLPGMNGVDFARFARALTDSMIVLVSGTDHQELEEVCALIGAHAALPKPLPEGEPAATIRKLLGVALPAPVAGVDPLH